MTWSIACRPTTLNYSASSSVSIPPTTRSRRSVTHGRYVTIFAVRTLNGTGTSYMVSQAGNLPSSEPLLVGGVPCARTSAIKEAPAHEYFTHSYRRIAFPAGQAAHYAGAAQPLRGCVW